MKRYKVVIFDIDGTLLNTSEGIINSVRYAEKYMGLRSINEIEIKTFLGPPPKLQYEKIYKLDSKKAEMATVLHRKYGTEHGIYEAKKYKYVDEILSWIKSHNIHLAVATLKRKETAEKILSIFEIKEYFSLILGNDVSENVLKNDQILTICEELQIKTNEALMIGDTIHDAIGAKKAGVDFIGVLYGYGFKSKEEIYRYDGINGVSSLKDLCRIIV